LYLLQNWDAPKVIELALYSLENSFEWKLYRLAIATLDRSNHLMVQKTPETLMDKGFSPRRQIWNFAEDRTKAMGFRGYFDHLSRPS
jgi:hypothetical protein